MPTKKKTKKKRTPGNKPVILPGKAVAETFYVYAEYPRELYDKLTDDEKRWLVSFTQNYDAGYFHSDIPSVMAKQSMKREAWNRKYARINDVMNRFDTSELSEDHETDLFDVVDGSNYEEDKAIAEIDLANAIKRARTNR